MLLVALLVAGVAAACEPTPSPGGLFVDQVVISGLDQPTAVRFAADGRVFVAEKRGVVKVFDSLGDTTPTVFADLRTDVYNFWDRGLTGLALHPNFPASPWVYVLYTRDADIGGTAPKWGTPNTDSDPCPSPPGPTNNGCVVSGRLARLQAAGNVMTGAPQVLVDDWCQQFPSHTVGALAFGRDGALYASAGEGAAFGSSIDYGQYGDPRNPCGDPPKPVGGIQKPPGTQGGALRAQDVRTPLDPTGLSGAVVRLDPNTGAAMPDNPMASSADLNARRIIAYGMRNPFRFSFRPDTDELWIGDVGNQVWEELNRVTNVRDSVVENFGWPCYEGAGRQPAWDAAEINLCENLYAAGAGAHTQPRYAYEHGKSLTADGKCTSGTSSITGLAFVPHSTTAYPMGYRGGLFFTDFSRRCLWFAPALSSGQPNFAKIRVVLEQLRGPVELQFGPDGMLYYVSLNDGAVRRIAYNPPPTAVIQPNPAWGTVPLQVQFDGTQSSDPSGSALTYAWDLDDDGAFDDSTAPKPTWTFTEARDYTVRLRVTDPDGLSGTTSALVSAGNTPPTAVIDTPSLGTTWKVGDTISFSGHADDAQQGTLPATSLSWSLAMRHCPGDCHDHPIQSFSGASGSFVAPDHEYPSHLVLTLTATDARGLQHTATRELHPQTATLTVQSIPSGLSLGAAGVVAPAPHSQTVIRGSVVSVSAPTPQTLDNRQWTFRSWSDGGAATHDVTVNGNTTVTATFD